MNKATQTTLQIYTDGACKNNPGKGGWAAVVCDDDGNNTEFYGSEANTTNNRMEMLAVIRAVEFAPPHRQLTIYTDSQYVAKGICEWLPNWRRRNFIKSDGKPVKNADLWHQLDALCQNRQINWQWVRGHDGNSGNERADFLASTAATQQIHSHPTSNNNNTP